MAASRSSWRSTRALRRGDGGRTRAVLRAGRGRRRRRSVGRDGRPRGGVRRRARAQHPDERGRHLRRRGRRLVGAPTRGRDHVRRLHHARDRPARQKLRSRTTYPVASSGSRSWSGRRAAPGGVGARSTRRAWKPGYARARFEGAMPTTAADAAACSRPPSPIRTRWSSSRTSRGTSTGRSSPTSGSPLPIGQANVVRPGRDVTVVALSRLV